MKDYVVVQMVEVQILAEDEQNAKDLAARSTIYWDDWNLAPNPGAVYVREGTLSGNSRN